MDFDSNTNIKLDKVKLIDKEQFDGLYEISRILNSISYQDTLIEDSLDIVIKHVNAERGLCAKYNEQDNSFEALAARNMEKESITELSQFSSGVIQQIINSRQPCLFHDVQSDPNLSHFASVQIEGIKSVIGVPIIRENKIWGVIIADSRLYRKEFTEENLVFLDFFSNLISLALDRIEKTESLNDENEILKNKLRENLTIPEIIGESTAMKSLAMLVHKVAQTDATILLLGESGSGKDLVATAIHQLSRRKEKPYLAQFCGSIPDTLLESELFGYKKGAFTGAVADKKGLFEIADKGTFFLDEIGDVSHALQAKLLRVIQNKEIMRLGGQDFIKIDVRIIAATNKNLKEMIKEGKFREDLFYRLNVFPIKIPPLRERKDDIVLLTKHFLKKFGTDKIKIEPAAIKKLESYFWPGNVRQLENVLHRATILCDSDKLLPEHIIYEDDEDVNSFSGTLAEYELHLLKKRLKMLNGNRTLTAKSLDVSLRWVHTKLSEMKAKGDGVE